MGENNRADTIGLRVIQHCGQGATIIKREKKKVVVRFDDGAVREDVSIDNFRSGLVAHPSKARKNGKRKKVLQSCGMYAEVIAENGNNDLTIRFDDGIEREHVKISTFYNGHAGHPNIKGTHKNTIKKGGNGYNGHAIEELKKLRVKMKCGEEARIIEWFSGSNITVQFATGDIVRHTTYASYRRGEISKTYVNNGLSSEHVGESKRMKDGKWGKIIRYYNSGCITVEFDNGTIVSDVSYYKFSNGVIGFNVKEEAEKVRQAIGTRVMQKCGQYATAIGYEKYTMLIVQFDNGFSRNGVKLYEFLEGDVKPKQKKLDVPIGTRVMQKCGQYAELIEYIKSRNVVIRFDTGEIRRNVALQHFLNGDIAVQGRDEKVQNLIGTSVKQSCGQNAKLIKYVNSKNIRVQFEDGFERNAVLTHFLNGCVAGTEACMHRIFDVKSEKIINNVTWYRLIEKKSKQRVVGSLDDIIKILNKKYNS